MVEVVGTSHMALPWAERKGDLAISRGVDPPGVERLQEGARLGNARLELGERLLVVLKPRRVDAGAPCGRVLGLVATALHLARECEHIREEALVQPRRRTDPLCFCIRLCLLEKRRGRVESALEHR